MSRSHASFAWLQLLMLCIGCSSSTPATTPGGSAEEADECAPGSNCTCTNGTPGTKVCDVKTKAFVMCDCMRAHPPVSSGTPAAAGSSASAVAGSTGASGFTAVSMTTAGTLATAAGSGASAGTGIAAAGTNAAAGSRASSAGTGMAAAGNGAAGHAGTAAVSGSAGRRAR